MSTPLLSVGPYPCLLNSETTDPVWLKKGGPGGQQSKERQRKPSKSNFDGFELKSSKVLIHLIIPMFVHFNNSP